MNEHTGPYFDSKSRHRKSQESNEPKNKQSLEQKENEGTKTNEETGKNILEMELCSDFSYHNYLVFLLSTF